MEFTPELITTLFIVSIFAGFIDSICGGGGLIVVPFLLISGCSPAQAIATSKLQSIFAKLSAVLYYYRKGIIRIYSMRLAVIIGIIGAIAGSLSIQFINPKWLQQFIPWVIGIVVLYLILFPNTGQSPKPHLLKITTFSLLVVPALSFYDGFLGIAAGTFFVMSFITLLGYDLLRATAYTKLLLLTTNAVALIVFILGGKVLWATGLSMAIGQWIGARYGTRLIIHKGTQFVRPILIGVGIALILKIVY